MDSVAQSSGGGMEVHVHRVVEGKSNTPKDRSFRPVCTYSGTEMESINNS